MKIDVSRLPGSERYPCTRKQLKVAAGDLDLNWVTMGYPEKRFRPSRLTRLKRQPAGVVVASALFSRQRSSHLSVFAVRRDEYPESASEAFVDHVLPHVLRWLRDQTSKPETQELGHEELVVSWDGENHDIIPGRER